MSPSRRISAWRTLHPRVWIVDNGSDDGSAEALAAEFPEIELLANPVNLGYGAANNLVLRRAETDFVLLLNNDAEIDEAASCNVLADTLQSRPEVACVGPWIVETGGGREIVKVGGRDIADTCRHSSDGRPTDPCAEGGRILRGGLRFGDGRPPAPNGGGGGRSCSTRPTSSAASWPTCVNAPGSRGHPSLVVPAARAVHESRSGGTIPIDSLPLLHPCGTASCSSASCGADGCRSCFPTGRCAGGSPSCGRCCAVNSTGPECWVRD